jgi:CBS domain-containing protein
MITVRQLLDIKGRKVFSVDPNATVFSAITQMAERGIGALVVLQEGALTGIISERDYLTKIVLKNRSSRETKVSEIMTPLPVSIALTSTIEDCMQIMTKRRVRHLPVVESGRVIGMISIGDVLKYMLDEKEQTIQQLSDYIAGHG